MTAHDRTWAASIYREIASKLREAARSCQFASTRRVSPIVAQFALRIVAMSINMQTVIIKTKITATLKRIILRTVRLVLI